MGRSSLPLANTRGVVLRSASISGVRQRVLKIEPTKTRPSAFFSTAVRRYFSVSDSSPPVLHSVTSYPRRLNSLSMVYACLAYCGTRMSTVKTATVRMDLLTIPLAMALGV